ncbi:MAG: Cys-Gln thioester bond-forming surface protein [Gracilibacteraceae bacterium]|nr:Cys-Gln thioester bond-forming surface protein [Gracilibacteraceae bacterium]
MMKSKRGNRRLGACALALGLLGGLVLALPLSVGAAPDANSYTVVLRYDDNIQLRYQHGSADEQWITTGDVPLGGAHLGGAEGALAIPQIYCVDAAVPFHSYAASGAGGSSSGWLNGATTDIVPNYVAAAPDQVPAVLGAHWRELEWVVMNGYQGSEQSLAAMNALFPALADSGGALGAFGADVAVTATKAAVWHFTNPDVVYLSTGFLRKSGGDPTSVNGVKHRQFSALFDALVNGAAAYAVNPSALGAPLYDVTPFGVYIDGTASARGVTADKIYYGPYYVRETQASLDSRAGVTRTLGSVFLQINTPGSGVAFYDGNPGSGGSEIAGDPSNLPYGGTVAAPSVPIGQPFYLVAPNDGAFETGALNLAVTALAREQITALDARTLNLPTVLLYQDPASGRQDWNTVQAFIGVAAAPLTQYASAVLPFGQTNTGNVSVTKFAAAAAGAGPFTFRLTTAAGEPVDLNPPSINFTGYAPDGADPDAATIVSAPDGIFRINGDSKAAAITGLPYGDYVVTEAFSAATAASYTVDDPELKTRAGRSALFSVTADDGDPNTSDLAHFVIFYNDAAPFDISLTKLNAESGAALAGVSFRLAGENINDVDIAGDAYGAAVFSTPLPGGDAKYTLTERAPAEGYNALSGPVAITVAGGVVTAVTPQPADAALISVSGLGSRHLRLVIANVPVALPPEENPPDDNPPDDNPPDENPPDDNPPDDNPPDENPPDENPPDDNPPDDNPPDDNPPEPHSTTPPDDNPPDDNPPIDNPPDDNPPDDNPPDSGTPPSVPDNPPGSDTPPPVSGNPPSDSGTPPSGPGNPKTGHISLGAMSGAAVFTGLALLGAALRRRTAADKTTPG